MQIQSSRVEINSNLLWTALDTQLTTTYASTTLQHRTMVEDEEQGILGRARGMSLSLLNGTPQLGMWQATGTAIAQAPNLTELREPGSGGSKITFDVHGHSTRIAQLGSENELTLMEMGTMALSSPAKEEATTPTLL
jgi:hypothetical protein